MSRYFTRASWTYDPGRMDEWDDEEPAQLPSFTVHEDELETFTGILDHRGHEIHRCERIRMGFERRRK